MKEVLVTYRRLLVVAIHLVLWTASYVLAFYLRFETSIPAAYLRTTPVLLLLLLGIRTVTFWRVGAFHGLWRYSSVRDLRTIVVGTSLSTLGFVGAVFFTRDSFPRTVFALEWIVAIMLAGGLRFGIRMVREVAVQSAQPPTGEHRRVLVVGAGDAGEMLVREMVRAHTRFEPIGFVDDNVAKHGENIHGVPVFGAIVHVEELVKDHRVDEVVLAIPSLTGPEMRRIVSLLRPTGVKIRTLPSVEDLIDGRATMSQLHDVRIEDLLGRDPVTLETEEIRRLIEGRAVLVTGAGGSIGSELCRQILRFGPRRLILVEQAENSLFEIHRALLAQHPHGDIVPCIADVCDSRRVDGIFEHHRPEVVFHAAAHKHVPMMEWNPGEAIKNNVFGTKKVADAAHRHGVLSFVMVSTDKAVNPTSIMGASKRVAEIYIQALSQRSRTRFVTVRFGNVLGSAGSVIPIFKEQIAHGGPVTVTHPEMRRYFMTIPEACQLVMQAGAMGEGGEIFILDMGEPVRIVDLAHELIRLSGFVPAEDIEVVFTGLRPGEKLFEELSVDSEDADKTHHPKIFVGRFRPTAWSDVESGLRCLHAATDRSDREAIVRAFSGLVPEYLSESPPSSAGPSPSKEPAFSPSEPVAVIS